MQVANYGGLVIKPDDPEKEGYKFAGWYKEKEYITEWDFETDTVNSDITLYAKWIKALKPAVELIPDTRTNFVDTGYEISFSPNDDWVNSITSVKIRNPNYSDEFIELVANEDYYIKTDTWYDNYTVSVLLYNKGCILPVIYPVALYFSIYVISLGYRYISELFERKRITSVFGRYVAPQVVNEIIEGGEQALKLGGSRRNITVLFVDIRGFTPLSEKAEPEEVVAILNEYLTLCAQSIFKFDGTLDKFIGDATMALFNAPLDLEDHAYKAVQAAWVMKQGAEPLKNKLEEKFGKVVQFGIGINTGDAVVGNIGADFRMDYTAIGDTVNTAARLESNAEPGQILLSESTYELVKDRVNAAYMGVYSMKGKAQGIAVYQLDGVKED